MNKKKESLRSTRAYTIVFALVFAVAAAFAAAYSGLPALLSVSYTGLDSASSTPGANPPKAGTSKDSTSPQTPSTTQTDTNIKTGHSVPLPPATHIATPASVKAIYMSQCVAGTPSFRDSLVKFIDDTELNAVVIDIKDYSGGIAFPSDDEALAPYVSKSCGAADMRAFVEKLHQKNIYVIGRITVFQDPTYAKAHPELAVKTKEGGVWKNYSGLAFIDVGAKPFWDYIVSLSKISYTQIGFDELNFDYIRFPSDGPMEDADYTFEVHKTKADALEEFFQYLHQQLKPTGVIMSADLFGYVTVHTDDLGIGQLLETSMPYFDYIDPMTYPSHYNAGFAGLKNVNSDPYTVVKVSLDGAVARALASTTSVKAIGETPIMKTVEVAATATTATTTKEVASGLYTKPIFPAAIIRPWLQAFDYPVPYTPAMVEAQIKANIDAGLNSYLMWDASNKYTSLRKVLANTQ